MHFHFKITGLTLSAAALKMFKYMCIDIDFTCMYIFDENSIMNEILGLVELILCDFVNIKLFEI